MIVLNTQTANSMNIYAADVGFAFAVLPASPVLHNVRIDCQLTNLAESSTRNLHVFVYSTQSGDVITSYYISLTNSDADDVLHFQVGPFLAGAGKAVIILIGSDLPGDTEATFTAYLLSDDMDYYLARRAAEASPTADSPIARVKLAALEATLTDIKGTGWATETLVALKAETALIVADTGELQTDWHQDGRLDVILDAAAAAMSAAGIRSALGMASADLDTQLDAIVEEDTTVIGAAGAGLTAVPWNSSWDAEVQSECNDALVVLKLDHLVAVADSDDPVDSSIVAKLASTTSDWSTFVASTDALQAIRDRGDANWGEADAASTSYTFTIINTTTSLPIAGVAVDVFSDAAKANKVETEYTDAHGRAKFALSDGTYYRTIFGGGYTDPTPNASFTVG